MEEMNRPSSGFLGVLAANNLGFGLALHEICQTFAFGQRQCQEDILHVQNQPHKAFLAY
jgi:hypothetical protein